MRNFIRNNIRTIIFIVVIALITGGIFLYRYIKQNQGTYEPNVDHVAKEIIKYEANQYIVYKIDKVDVYRSYYKDFMKLLATDPVKAYSKLTKDSKTHMFNDNYDKFLEYVKKLDKSVLLSGEVKRYSDEKKKIILVDNTDSSYVFYEDGVWNYTVDLSRLIK